MTKTEAFTSDEAKRNTLRDALPVVLEALDAAKDELEYARINAGVTDNVTGNSFFQQIVGAKHLITRLPDFTKVTTPPAQLEGRRQYTEADREALMDSHDKQ